MIRKPLITLSAVVAAAGFAAPAQAEVVQLINDSVPSMALTNTSTTPATSVPQMYGNFGFTSQEWNRDYTGASPQGYFKLISQSILSEPMCLKEKPSTSPTPLPRVSSCSAFSADISWRLNETRQLVNGRSGKVLAVLPSSSPSFAGLRLQAPTDVPATRWKIRVCGPFVPC